MNQKAQGILDEIVDLIAVDVAQLGVKLRDAVTAKEWTVDDARRLGIYADRLEAIIRHQSGKGTKDRSLDELMERALKIPELADALRGRLKVTGPSEVPHDGE